MQHKLIRMNPKAIRAEEMFGETNKASGEWVDGVFAAMWSKFNDRNRKDMQVNYVLWRLQEQYKQLMLEYKSRWFKVPWVMLRT